MRRHALGSFLRPAAASASNSQAIEVSLGYQTAWRAATQQQNQVYQIWCPATPPMRTTYSQRSAPLNRSASPNRPVHSSLPSEKPASLAALDYRLAFFGPIRARYSHVRRKPLWDGPVINVKSFLAKGDQPQVRKAPSSGAIRSLPQSAWLRVHLARRTTRHSAISGCRWPGGFRISERLADLCNLNIVQLRHIKSDAIPARLEPERETLNPSISILI